MKTNKFNATFTLFNEDIMDTTKERFYTKITIETSYGFQEVHRSSVYRSAYDLNTEQMVDLVQDALRGHGWTDKQVAVMFNENADSKDGDAE